MIKANNSNYLATYIASMAFLFNAGWIDSIVLYDVYSESVTYMTGNFSSMGNAIASEDLFFLANVLALIVGFIFGAALSGMMLKSDHLYFDKAFGRTLLLQALFTWVGLFLMNRTGFNTYAYYDLFFLAVAMGIQNSLTTIYSGGIGRTTHLTGTATDFGIQLGRFIGRKSYDKQKLIFLGLSMVIFTCGAAMGGTWTHYSKEDYIYLLLPSVVIPLSYAVYYIWLNKRNDQNNL